MTAPSVVTEPAASDEPEGRRRQDERDEDPVLAAEEVGGRGGATHSESGTERRHAREGAERPEEAEDSGQWDQHEHAQLVMDVGEHHHHGPAERRGVSPELQAAQQSESEQTVSDQGQKQDDIVGQHG